MISKNCLNCGKELTDRYCSGCGQEADTHRISFRNFISHDLLHGTFHIERGMLFTARQALVRPGKAALDYISGKRKRYYNVFYLILITTGLILFFRHFYDQIVISLGEEIVEKPAYINEASRKMDEIFSQKSKFIIFLFVPFAALSSYVLFRRKKLNLSEHSIIAGMVLLGMLLISAFGHLFFYFDLIIEFNETFADIVNLAIPSLIVFQIGHGYWNAFREDYTTIGISYRIGLFFAMLALQALILLFLMIGYVSDWKFGAVHFNPY
ncbi:MAG TPA: DUF3667 domain-containing protein [Flavobacterium sp.]|jgi:hypothetical protein